MNSRSAIERTFHGIAGVGPLLFLAVATLEGLLRAGYDSVAQPISALGVGPRGWVQTLNFALLAVSFFSFAAVLKADLKRGVSSMAAPGLFVVMAIGVTIAAAFPMDPPGVPVTLTARLHDVGGFLVFPWIPLVALLLARRFRQDGDWRAYFRYTLATGLFCLTMLVFFLIFVGPPSAPARLASEYRGLVQRTLLVPFFVWIAVVTRHAYRRRESASVSLKAGSPAKAATAH
jgi:hypothetical protein